MSRHEVITVEGYLTEAGSRGNARLGLSATVVDTLTGAERGTFRTEERSFGGAAREERRRVVLERAHELAGEWNRKTEHEEA